jgi:hypothetical protein
MKKILKIKILFIIFEILFIFILFILLPTVAITSRTGTQNLESDDLSPVLSNNTYIQTFTSSQNNLESVSFLLKNPANLNRQSFTLELLDNNKNTIQKLDFNGFGVGDPSWIIFKFPPIQKSKNETYKIQLFTNESTDNHISIYTNSKDNSYVFQTTHSTGSFYESFKTNLDLQSQKYISQNQLVSVLYLLLIFSINIAFLLS